MEVLVLGTGIAGLSTALKLASQSIDGLRVTLMAKMDPLEGSTRYAQGGIASVWSDQDHFDLHIRDTLDAGAGLCDADIVRLCVHEGPARVRELIELGVEFTKRDLQTADPSEYDLHREGGHTKRRILHADDLTGLAIEKTLYARAASHPKIRILEHHVAIDLITEGKLFRRFRKPGRCLGAYALNARSGEVLTLAADATVLATGGAGKVYLYTSNPDVATGDGIAMAVRAGARVANLEFMQFHPTCLYHPAHRTFLITEALRGEGAILKTLSGEPFMERYHALSSLAPRDVVARAIDMEMKRTGDRHVLLDATSLGREGLRKKFPNIYETCLKVGVDISVAPIPVVPAAHYMCGGVLVDRDAKTTIDGLYAVGEVACTGLHGANRLASNSLLEAVVFAHVAANHVGTYIQSLKVSNAAAPPFPSDPTRIPSWNPGNAVKIEERIDIAATWTEIRSLMWNYVGIVRSDQRLERAKRRLSLLKDEINSTYWKYLLTPELIELRNLLTVAESIVQCAQLRKESRGLHYTVDYPDTNDRLFHASTVI